MLYKNAEIFYNGKFVHGNFRVEDGYFAQVLCKDEGNGMDLNGQYVIPGLIDVHTHGNSGEDFSDGNYEGIVKMATYLGENGVTSFAPASMTLPYETLSKAYAAGLKFHEAMPERKSRLMGIQMEGPFFSEKKKGAQNGAYLKNPDAEAFVKLYHECKGLIRIADLAPELPGSEEYIRKISSYCTVSIAHTDASYEEAQMAINAGATHVTHLFNAMPPIHHRKPGVIGAASENKNVVAELICDGLHVHPSVVRMAFMLFPGRICLISDSLRCCGMPEGEYELGGQQVFLKDSIAKLEDGTIAGSASNLYQCMLNAISFGIPMEDAILAATLVPAKEIREDDELGSIDAGKRADFVVCGPRLERRQVYIGGLLI